MVLEDPLGFTIELVGSFGNLSDRRISKLHPFRNVGVPDFVVFVGVMTTLEFVGFEFVEDRFCRTFRFLLFAPTTLALFVVFVFEFTFIFLRKSEYNPL
jgi:uncharacterized membrane protein